MTLSDAPTSDLDAMVEFFDDFGFVHLPGLFADEADRIDRGFDDAFAKGTTVKLPAQDHLHHARDERFRDDRRDMVFGFIEQSDDLAWIRHDERLTSRLQALLGEDYLYAQSDGNRFNCDVRYHSDAFGMVEGKRHVKVYFYPDALDADTGCLRMIPGTHRRESDWAKTIATKLYRADADKPAYSAEQASLPCWPIETQPGDVIIGDFLTVHGTFGGRPGRRLFTINFRQA